MVRTQYRPPLEIQDFRDFPKVLFLFRLPLVYLTVSEPYNRIRHPNPADGLASEWVIPAEEAYRPRRSEALVAPCELLRLVLPRFALFLDGGLKHAELSGYPLKTRVLRCKVLAQRAQLRRLRLDKLRFMNLLYNLYEDKFRLAKLGIAVKIAAFIIVTCLALNFLNIYKGECFITKIFMNIIFNLISRIVTNICSAALLA